MNVCYHCGKGILYGRSHTHHRGVAGGRWKKRAPKTRRIFEVNLQPVNIMENGKVKRVKLCTKCLKRVRKDIKDGVRPFLQLAQYNKAVKEVKSQKVKVKNTNKKSNLKSQNSNRKSTS